jgi:hypothetical protein
MNYRELAKITVMLPVQNIPKKILFPTITTPEFNTNTEYERGCIQALGIYQAQLQEQQDYCILKAENICNLESKDAEQLKIADSIDVSALSITDSNNLGYHVSVEMAVPVVPNRPNVNQNHDVVPAIPQRPVKSSTSTFGNMGHETYNTPPQMPARPQSNTGMISINPSLSQHYDSGLKTTQPPTLPPKKFNESPILPPKKLFQDLQPSLNMEKPILPPRIPSSQLSAQRFSEMGFTADAVSRAMRIYQQERPCLEFLVQYSALISLAYTESVSEEAVKRFPSRGIEQQEFCVNVCTFIEYGFTAEQSMNALIKHGGDKVLALESLLK